MAGSLEKPTFEMKCQQCGKELYEFEFLSLRKYAPVNDEKILEESFDFCSTNCAKGFLGDKRNLSDFELYKASRCVGYYDCKRLDNLRRMCETEEPVKKESRISISFTPLLPQCSPAEVGIIKANIKLLDLLEKFDETSTKINQRMLKYTGEMNKLTKWILGFTVANAFFIVIQIILRFY